MSWKKDIPHKKVLLQAASNFFNLGAVQNIQRIGGSSNKNYLVVTKKGEYIFKILLEHTIHNIYKELSYLNHLKKYNFPAAYYLQSPSGKSIFQKNNFLIGVLPKLNGESPNKTITTAKTIGRNLAKLHLIPSKGLSKRENYLSFSYLPKSLAILEKHFPGEVGKYKDVYEEIRPFLSSGLNESVVHLDLLPENCLFDHNKLVAFLDWEEVTIAPSVLDIATCTHRFCFIDNVFVPNLYTNFMKSYTQTRGLTTEEWHNLIKAIKYVVLCTSVWLFLQFSLYHPGSEKEHRKNLYWMLRTDKLELPRI